MFAYDHWANRECLAAMRTAGLGSGGVDSRDIVSRDVVGRMAHILSAQKLWLERILKQAQSMPVWPDSTIDDCIIMADEAASAWQDFLTRSRTSGSSLDEKVEYRNTKGESWSSRVEDVLLHVLFHSSYHRGQIALQMRAAGHQPAFTDFIHAVRQGFVE